MLTLLLGSYAKGFAQKLAEVKVRVTDAETKTGITDANVLIQETMMTAKTAQFGLAVFPSVPVRQVTIEVQKDGYVPKKEEINITTDPFNNAFAFELVKEKSNTVTIYGVVKAGSKRLPDVNVVLRIGGFEQKAITSKTGDYTFQIPNNRITAKVKLLFTHSRYADQEREFEIIQNQSVKEVYPVVLSGAMENGDLKPGACTVPSKKYVLGEICFDNQTGLDLKLHSSSARNVNTWFVDNLLLVAGKTACTEKIVVNYFEKEVTEREYGFVFQTVSNNPTDKVRYGKITVLVEQCKRKVILLNKQNISFSDICPRTQ